MGRRWIVAGAVAAVTLTAAFAFAAVDLTVTSIVASDAGDGTLTVETLDAVDSDGQAWQLDGTATLTPVSEPVYDRVLEDGETFPDGFTVPAGESWGFDPDATVTVETEGNVIVEGELVAHPASADVVHTLRFVGIDESKFVGGHTDEPLDSDVGLWVTSGRLDFVGTERAGWNRTGSDPSWLPDDELIVAPQEQGDFTTFASYTGGPVPSVEYDGEVYPTEVANLTRNVIVETEAAHTADVITDGGRAHVILLGCEQPSTIKHATFRNLGPRADTGGQFTTYVDGRNPLHLHMCGAGSAGTVVEGVVISRSGSGGISPHMSHGVTIRDTVVYDVYEWGMSWPSGPTDDLLIDRTAVMRVRAWPSFRGLLTVGFDLRVGERKTIQDSVAVGVQGNSVNAGAFRWRGSHEPWDFSQGNVAHNNRGPGLAVWENTDWEHPVSGFVAYRNSQNVSHGAYVAGYHYSDAVTFDGPWVQHALSPTAGKDRDHRVARVLIGGDLQIETHAIASTVPVVYEDVRIDGKVRVRECSRQGGVIQFRSSTPETDLSRDDFDVQCLLSTITVTNSDATSFTIEP
jgi:hypothetical protein